MMKMRTAPLAVLLVAFCLSGGALAQSAANETGALQFTARITPTAARPEPVRQFTFYILSKSYAAVSEEVEATDVVPPRDQFIDDLKVSPELKEWLKAPRDSGSDDAGLDKALTRRRRVARAGIFAGVPAFEQRRRDQRNSQAEI